jgi:hypothetical protein
LVIESPWIDLILAGDKTWEVRKRRANQRHRIALIKSGSGRIFGTCRVVDCVGPLSIDELHANKNSHKIPRNKLGQYWEEGKTYAWVLADPQAFEQPIPYRHKSGAVIWVTLTQENVPNRFDELAAATQ